MNYLDYCKINRDKTFSQLPLNELDFAIFSEIAYFPMDNIVFDFTSQLKISFNDLCEKLLNLYITNPNVNPYLFMAHRLELLQIMIHSKRYQSIQFLAYEDFEDDKVNFTAVTLELDVSTRVIAFRGTTDSVIGWREDFELTYTESIGSQLMAKDYLNAIIERDDTFTYYLTGHSKGANLAVYAASNLDPTYEDNIDHIYAFDGPGFSNIDEYSENFEQLNRKISHFIPKFSIVGLLLNHYTTPIVVDCDAHGLLQHLTALWETNSNSFSTVDAPSSISQLFEATAKEWLSLTSLDQRKRYFDQLFDLLQLSGLTSILQINEKPLEWAHILRRSYRNQSLEDRDFFKSHTQQIVEITKKHYQDNEAKISSEHKPFSNLIRFYQFFNQPNPPLSNRMKKFVKHLEINRFKKSE